jgi:malate dehydrogenase (oxaloacetate-decarboxylating)
MKGADVFIGVSQANIVTEEMVRSMNKDAIIFAMANPVPEIMPDLAKKAGARVVGTGRLRLPQHDQQRPRLPRIFRGAFDVRATTINEDEKLAAANALSLPHRRRRALEDYFLPKPLTPASAPPSLPPSPKPLATPASPESKRKRRP